MAMVFISFIVNSRCTKIQICTQTSRYFQWYPCRKRKSYLKSYPVKKQASSINSYFLRTVNQGIRHKNYTGQQKISANIMERISKKYSVAKNRCFPEQLFTFLHMMFREAIMQPPRYRDNLMRVKYFATNISRINPLFLCTLYLF